VSVKVIRKFCLQCQGGDRRGVEECPTTTCPFHEYRFGTNPARRGVGASRKALRNVREQGKMAQESILFSREGKGEHDG